VASFNDVGTQPFGLAVDQQGNAARLFVSSFGDGRVAVLEIPDLLRPQGLRLVTQLGKSQACLTGSNTCSGEDQ
jgi:hypothetical protein